MKLMADLNQRSMQTPSEEETRRINQVEEIQKRVEELQSKYENRKKQLDQIISDQRDERAIAEKKSAELTNSASTVETDNKVELQKLKSQ